MSDSDPCAPCTPAAPTHLVITHPDGRTEVVRLEDVQAVPEHLREELP